MGRWPGCTVVLSRSLYHCFSSSPSPADAWEPMLRSSAQVYHAGPSGNRSSCTRAGACDSSTQLFTGSVFTNTDAGRQRVWVDTTCACDGARRRDAPLSLANVDWGCVDESRFAGSLPSAEGGAQFAAPLLLSSARRCAPEAPAPFATSSSHSLMLVLAALVSPHQRGDPTSTSITITITATTTACVSRSLSPRAMHAVAIFWGDVSLLSYFTCMRRASVVGGGGDEIECSLG